MIKKVAAIIMLPMVTSVPVAGCTINTSAPSTTPTPTHSADLRSYFEKFDETWERITGSLEAED
jgi:hypothetical protein